MSIRERERQPERERRRHDYDWNEARALQRQRIGQLFDDGPRVVRYDDVPWEPREHQSFNASSTEKVTVLVARSNDYNHYGFGGIEHLEDARY